MISDLSVKSSGTINSNIFFLGVFSKFLEIFIIGTILPLEYLCNISNT